jgi:hypothetical protein
MNFRTHHYKFLFLVGVFLCLFSATGLSQKFVHPGIDQTAQDLALMKKFVLEGKQPYKDAFDRLKIAADSPFLPVAHTHVLRGPYGRPNIGGDDLRNGANLAYDNALVWYVTGDKKYANKAIDILNAWSPTLWDFDYNDAKLLAAWTGHLMCNAAEILRYTNAGWQSKDIDAFRNMLMTVYYPLLRHYFPQANGNWDGAIIHSLMAMGIFLDDRKIFDNALDHFLHGPVNGSIFKYIYPNGQCQETPRDQGHVQLGLGEFAGAAQIGYTQGVDLFSIADNRIGLGFEYTAGFLLGEKPQCYCLVSERAKGLRDDYEYVYRHYLSKGIALPWTKKAADSVRSKASRSVLSAVRYSAALIPAVKAVPTASPIAYVAGAVTGHTKAYPQNPIVIHPGQSIQKALDSTAQTGRWVILKAGIHMLPSALKIPSGITLAGEGIGTILFLDPNSGMRDAIVNATNDMQDVTIQDLVIEGALKTQTGDDPNTNRSFKGGYNRGGILFRSLREGQMKNINLLNITIRNCTFNGAFISGADNLRISKCDFNENGGNAVPGPKIQHNLLLSHCRQVNIAGSRMATSPFGSGIALDHCTGVVVSDCEVARNAWYGMLVSESKNISISKSLIEANDRSGILLEFLYRGNADINIKDNIIHYNNGFGLESYATARLKAQNKYAGNGKAVVQERLSQEKILIQE